MASVVGLTIIHIFGFDSPEASKLAEKCGVAFQLTNILRDVREDAEKDRVYLPQEDLDRFRVRTAERAGSPALCAICWRSRPTERASTIANRRRWWR